MISDDEYIERIVAALNRYKMADAEVNWNVKLNKRQFDVAATFANGMYDFLILFEVRNKGRRTPASEIESFVTKSNDCGAQKAVFVSRNGYQSGAIEVAARHKIDLFSISFDVIPSLGSHQWVSLKERTTWYGILPPPAISIGKPEITNQVCSVKIIYADGTKIALPTEQSQMQYCAEQTVFSNGQSINNIIYANSIAPVSLGENYRRTINLDRGIRIEQSDEYFIKHGLVKSIEIEVQAVMSQPVTGNTQIELSSFRTQVVYKNELTQEEYASDLSNLPFGKNKFEVGSYYFLYFPLRYYFCEKIDDEVATLILVESFQIGQLVQARFTIKNMYASMHIPLQNKKIIKRIQSRYKQFLLSEKKQ